MARIPEPPEASGIGQARLVMSIKKGEAMQSRADYKILLANDLVQVAYAYNEKVQLAHFSHEGGGIFLNHRDADDEIDRLVAAGVLPPTED